MRRKLMDYARALRLAREIRGMQQKELAIKAELDKATISLYEQGKRNPSLRALGRLTAALGTTPMVITLLAAPGPLSPQEYEQIGRFVKQAVLEQRKGQKR